MDGSFFMDSFEGDDADELIEIPPEVPIENHDCSEFKCQLHDGPCCSIPSKRKDPEIVDPIVNPKRIRMKPDKSRYPVNISLVSEPELPVFFLPNPAVKKPRNQPTYTLKISNMKKGSELPMYVTAKYHCPWTDHPIELMGKTMFYEDGTFEVKPIFLKTGNKPVKLCFSLFNAFGTFVSQAFSNTLVVISNCKQRKHAAFEILGFSRLYDSVEQPIYRTWEEVKRWLENVLSNLPSTKGVGINLKIDLDLVKNVCLPGPSVYAIDINRYRIIVAETCRLLKERETQFKNEYKIKI